MEFKLRFEALRDQQGKIIGCSGLDLPYRLLRRLYKLIWVYGPCYADRYY